MTETVEILSTLAVKVAFEQTLLPAWAATGAPHRIIWMPSNLMAERIADGLRGDVVVLIDSYMETLAANGTVLGASVRPVATAQLGLGVRAGESLPPIANAADFARVLLECRRVVWSRRGASGIHFEQLIDRLGIGDEIRSRGMQIEAGFTSEKLITGEADIAIQQQSEIMSVAGAVVGAAFPPELQEDTLFSAAIFADAPNPAAAARFLDHLTDAAAGRAYAAGGLLSRLGPEIAA